jgi:hypothetical protein
MLFNNKTNVSNKSKMQLRSGKLIINKFNSDIKLRSGRNVKHVDYVRRAYKQQHNYVIRLRSGRNVKHVDYVRRTYNHNISEEEEPSQEQYQLTLTLRSGKVVNRGDYVPRAYNRKDNQQYQKLRSGRKVKHFNYIRRSYRLREKAIKAKESILTLTTPTVAEKMSTLVEDEKKPTTTLRQNIMMVFLASMLSFFMM